MDVNKSLTIAIVGLGMIGGSIALGLKQSLTPCPRIIAVDRNEQSLALATRQGIVELTLTAPGPELAQADIVFLCTPVLQMESVIAEVVPFLRAGSILTDVGSTKAWLRPRLQRLLPDTVCYIGGHPMAGREQSGYSAACASLFLGKWYILCPEPTTNPQALAVVTRLVSCLGAKIAKMDVELHDQCAAVISHLPHVAAAAMVNVLDCYPDPETSLQLAGGGFHDTTRIASSDADMWADICISNAPAILDSLESYQQLLAGLAQAIADNDRAVIHQFFQRAKKRRDSLLQLMATTCPATNRLP